MEDFLTLKGGDVEIPAAPELIPVLPLGHVISTKGEFDVDEESLREMKAGIAGRGVDLVVDYEHQTMKGCQAPAAGWVKELTLKDDHIYARVDWTQKARGYLENREYRYLSPVVGVRKPDGKAVNLYSLALTNTPAIEDMTPIVNKNDPEEGGQPPMDLLQELAALLGLAEGATQEEVLKALQGCVEENNTLKEEEKEGGGSPQEKEETLANKDICETLGLQAGASQQEITQTIMELKGGIVGGINLHQRIADLEQQQAKRNAGESVTLALKAGKITPAQQEWATTYALKDPGGFAAFVEKAPQAVPLGEFAPERMMALKHDTTSPETLAICKDMGLSEEDVKLYGKGE